ncbi:MAG TPA: hypothetical protein DCP69_10290 [Candidatus Omnitrophica bacterium]|nr:hypothetical protein [Candidatus Omnitrophota bacterium]
MAEQSVGAQFKQARAELRLALKDIAQATKIQPWVLEALEQDTLHKTMSPVYAKGFIATYAKCLRLDPEPLVRQLYPPVPPQPVESEPVGPASAEPAMRRPVDIPWYLFRRVGTVAVGLIVLVVMVRAKPLRTLSISAPRREASVTVTTQPKALRVESLVIPLNQSLELKAIARRPTWISVESDGRLLTQRELVAGAQETWKAKRQFKLVVAKPFHVDVLLNGHSISPLLLAHRGRVLIQHRRISALPDAPGTPELKIQAGVSAE